MTGPAVPSTGAAISALAGVTLKRLGRGKALWIGGLIAALPVAYTWIVRTRGGTISTDAVFALFVLLLVLVPAMFVGASVGEELEERTSTYLWSRPIARWAVLAGKLAALVPVVTLLLVGGWCVAGQLTAQALPSALSCVALAVGCVVASIAAAGIATIVPKHGMALTIGYLLVDFGIGALPFSVHELAISYQVGALAHLGGGPLVIRGPVIALAVITALWGVIGFTRIRRLEA